MNVQTINIKEAQKIMTSGKFFGIRGYVKSNGELRNFNARTGVKKHSNGGVWNGNIAKNLLLAEPISPQSKKMAEQSNMRVNPYRTIKLESLIGCELHANGKVYKIIA